MNKSTTRMLMELRTELKRIDRKKRGALKRVKFLNEQIARLEKEIKGDFQETIDPSEIVRMTPPPAMTELFLDGQDHLNRSTIRDLEVVAKAQKLLNFKPIPTSIAPPEVLADVAEYADQPAIDIARQMIIESDIDMTQKAVKAFKTARSKSLGVVDHVMDSGSDWRLEAVEEDGLGETYRAEMNEAVGRFQMAAKKRIAEPGTVIARWTICDFCGVPEVKATLKAESFSMEMETSEGPMTSSMDEDWAICEECLKLATVGNWEAVRVRSLEMFARKAKRAFQVQTAESYIRKLHQKFRERWDGSFTFI